MKMKIIETSPLLVSRTRTGKDKYWRGEVVQIGKDFFTRSEYWQTNNKGLETKHLFSEPYLASPKNVGKKNETSGLDQAKSELESTVKKRRDKGYSEVGKKSENLPLPMLAQKFTERKHKLKWPCFVQPKLNGQRMLYDGSKAWSRGGKLVIPECIAHLQFDTNRFTVDGELMLDGELLQETMKAIKKYRPEVSSRLKYYVYDIVDDRPFSERNVGLRLLAKEFPENVILVETYEVANEEQVIEYHKKFIQEGYEGTMVRSRDGKYEIGHRSNSLQKYKDFKDEEFRIIGVEQGEGSDRGLAIFVCEAKNGKSFNARPEGTRESRMELWKDRNSLVGRYLTVRYFELTGDGIPQFPVGVEVRDEADFK